MNIRIDRNASVVPHKKHWQFCVGSGHALLALRADYVRQLKFIHDTLGIERVRFHGIFCDDMHTVNDLSMQMPVPGADRFTEYNFNACALAYDNVLEAGMKPFVELSFMPSSLAKHEEGRPLQGMFFYKPVIVPPADEKKWQEYIQTFLRFLIHRYGAEEVRTWYFEVWNEPDLQVIFWNGTREEYFHFYKITAEAVKAVDPQIRVGGPATSGSKWVESFLKYCRSEHVPVDFVTTHQYAGDPLGGVEDQGEDTDRKEEGGESWGERMARLSKQLDSIEEKTFLNGFRTMQPDKSETTEIPADLFARNSAIVRRQAGDVPVYYTEWNENAIFSAWTNDTRKVAAYDVRAALEVAANVDGSSIWCFSDIFEELHPFPQEFHGGFGMLSQHGIPKPVYWAMKMLRETRDERLDLGADATSGEVGYAAFPVENGLKVLLFRQRMKNLDLPGERVELELPGVKASGVSVQRVDEEHGNPLKCWQDMGSPEWLNREEVEKIRKDSCVCEEAWPFVYDGEGTKCSFELGVNDVYMITVRV